MFHGMGVNMMRIEGGKAWGSYGPSFDEGPGMRLLPVSEWWNQIVYVFSWRPEDDPTGEIEVTRLSRKDIVLTATNKDGGRTWMRSEPPPTRCLRKMAQ